MLAPSPAYQPPWTRFQFWFVVSALLFVAANGLGLPYMMGAPLPPLVVVVLGIGGGILAIGAGAIGLALYFNRPRLIRWAVVGTVLALGAAAALAVGYVRMVIELHGAFMSFPF